MASHKLHKYYRGIVIPQLKDRLNQLKVCPFLLEDDDVHIIVKGITKTVSTANFDNTSFNLFLEQVWCWGAHLGIYIDDPNESLVMDKLKELTDLIIELLVPYVGKIEPLKLDLTKEITLYIRDKKVELLSHLFTENHLEISIQADTQFNLITCTSTLEEGSINDLLYEVKNIHENYFSNMLMDRSSVIEKQIKCLQEELSTLSNNH